MAQAKQAGSYQQAYDAAYESAYQKPTIPPMTRRMGRHMTRRTRRRTTKPWDKILDEIDEKYQKAEDKYELNDPDFAAVPVNLFENFYRNEEEDHDGDGVPDGNVRVFKKTDEVNLACLMEGSFPGIFR